MISYERFTCPEYTFTITNSCICEDFDEETQESTPAPYCYGCFDDDQDTLKRELEQWREVNYLMDTELFDIEVGRIGWQNLPAYATVKFEDLFNALKINGEYRIEFYFGENYSSLTACRFSHDEPVGTGLFTFREHKEEEN